MPATHHRDFIYQLRVLLVFIEFNILICILMERQRRAHLNRPPSPAIQPQPQPAHRRRRKTQNHWVLPWILQRQEKGYYSNLLADLIHTDIPGYQNFVRMPCASFDLIKERINHHIKKSVINFRKPLAVGLKLAIILRHLATGETYTSLQYHWLVGPTTICKFIPQVCPAILAEFQDEYLHCPDSPDEWKRVEKKFRSRWNFPHSVDAIDGKHITIKKPNESQTYTTSCWVTTPLP